jgi:effector-binding domain-containing protein
MKIIDALPINFLCFRTATTLAELPGFAAVTQEIIAEAVRLKLAVTGAAHWHYFGLTDRSKPFTLEISIPVGSVVEGYDGKFHFKRTDTFHAVSAVHYGAWDQLPDTYGKMFDFIREKRSSPTDVREIYVNVDFVDPKANVTEIQIGISNN